MGEKMKKIKKYVLIDLLTGIGFCILAGFLVFVLNKKTISQKMIEQCLDLFGTVTGSFYITIILSRIKTKDFSERKTKEEIRKITILSIMLIIIRLISLILYQVIWNNAKISANILSGVIDFLGIVILYRLLPNKKQKK